MYMYLWKFAAILFRTLNSKNKLFSKCIYLILLFIFFRRAAQ